MTVGLRPTARGAGVAAAGGALLVVGVLTRTNGPYALAALAWVPLVIAPVVAWRRAGACRSLSLHARALPALVPVGATLTLEVVGANHGSRRTPVLGIEWRRAGRRRPLAPAVASLAPFPAVPPGAGASIVVTRTMRRRGRFDAGSGRAWVNDHFGLCAATVATLPPVRVYVHPAPIDVALTPAFGASGAEPSDAVTPAAQDGELTGLRAYVAGDRLHLVHWPTQGRADGPYVKEFGTGAHRRVRIVIDDRAGAHRRQPFEEMLGMVAGLLSEASARRLDVELATLSGLLRTVTPDATGRALALSTLSTLRPRLQPAGRVEPTPCTVVTTGTGAETLPVPWRAVATLVVAP